jgi:hypothetical protein
VEDPHRFATSLLEHPIGGGSRRTFGHGDAAPGMGGDLGVFPGSGYIVASLANMDGIAIEVSNYICCRLPPTA